MNKIWESYFERFYKNSNSNRPVIKNFFTQFGNDYISELPYIVDIEIWCLRVFEALVKNETVCIYSDYDTDAVTATATMYWGLINFGFKAENISFYAPDRFSEGYGMNPEAVAMLATKYDLIISVDCGINSINEAQEVLKIGKADLMITDHHHLQGELPDCLAVVNPRVAVSLNDQHLYQKHQEFKKYEFENRLKNLLSSEFISKQEHVQIASWYAKLIKNNQIYNSNTIYLSTSVTGVGVAWFCLVWFGYFLGEMRQIEVKTLNKLLPFVAIGTIADCQSVLDSTNRLLVRSGLSVLQKTPTVFLGLGQLMIQNSFLEKMQGGYNLTSQDLGFILSPILNSSGRVSHASLSINTLISQNIQTASENAIKLIQTNQERKQMVKDILQEVENEAESQFLANNKLVWLQGDWSKGIVGLLASRLVSKYNLPVVVVSFEEGLAVASLRAPEGFHLPKAMELAQDYIIKFGGHPCAAGFSAEFNNLEMIKTILAEALENQALEPEVDKTSFLPENYPVPPKEFNSLKFEPKVLYLTPDELNIDLLHEVWKLDPFGQDFPLPELLFWIDTADFSFRLIGNNKHLKSQFKQINLTFFNIIKEQINTLNSKSFTRVWVTAKPSQNTWNGQTKSELIIQNMYFS